jgi:hypothetical protein
VPGDENSGPARSRASWSGGSTTLAWCAATHARDMRVHQRNRRMLIACCSCVRQVDRSALSGICARRAKTANNKFILEQRAEMRARLVQLAIENTLKYGQAKLAGFAKTTPINLADGPSGDADPILL